MTLSFNQVAGFILLLIAGVSFVFRSRLLCREAQGWPHASFPVRAACFGLGLWLMGRGLVVALRHDPVDDARLATSAALAVYGVVMAVNLLLQRTGWALGPQHRPTPTPNHGPNGHDHEAKRQPAPEPPSFLAR